MDIASVVGAERLREIMAELVNITTAVVKRYGAAGWCRADVETNWEVIMEGCGLVLGGAAGG